METNKTSTSEIEEELPPGFVTPTYGDSPYDTLKLKPNTSFEVCPCPPIHGLRKTGASGKYWRTHFGYSAPDPKDATKTRFVPIVCLEQKEMRNQAARECPLDAPFSKRDARAKKVKAAGEARNPPVPPDKLKKLIAENGGDWCYAHNVDGKVRMPVLQRNGRYAIFLLPYGFYKKWQAKANATQSKMIQNGVKPEQIGRYGAWWTFSRAGDRVPFTDDAQVVQVQVQGAELGVTKTDIKKWSNAEIARAEEVLPDLDGLCARDTYTSEQLQLLADAVEAGDGAVDPIAVEHILDLATRRGSKSSSNGSSKGEPQAVNDDDDDWVKEVAGDTKKADEPAPEAKKEPEVKKEETKAKPVAAAAKTPETKKQAAPTPAAKEESLPGGVDEDIAGMFDDDDKE